LQFDGITAIIPLSCHSAVDSNRSRRSRSRR